MSGKSTITPNDDDVTNSTRDSINSYNVGEKYQVQAPFSKFVRLKNYVTNKEITDRLGVHAAQSHGAKTACGRNACASSLMRPPTPGYLSADGGVRTKEQMLVEATDFMQQYYESINKQRTDQHNTRLSEICDNIDQIGTYELTSDELKFGAKLAWRNAPRCIGRIQWNNLELFDARSVKTTRGMFEAICEHLKFSTNGGNIRSTVTVFRQHLDNVRDIRIWNSQLVRYAGYAQDDGSVIGDPISQEFTQICENLGWKGKGGMFDLLPLVLQAESETPELYEIPHELVPEVQLTHPKYDWFPDLGLKWYPVPYVTDMMMDVGGLQFTAVPFNGWYMGAEIGSRNFGDAHRYNMLEPMARRMGLDTSTNTSLWKDMALVELNVAVLHSFKLAKVTIIDHHTVAESFIQHMEKEQRVRGGCPADWVWIVPPISGSVTPVFHQEMMSYQMKPAFLYQIEAWKIQSRDIQNRKPLPKLRTVALAILYLTRVMRLILANRPKVTVLYATETGKSEGFAHRIADIFKMVFDVKVICMEDYDTASLPSESFVLVVTSTFGNGEPPTNGEAFTRTLKKLVQCNNNLKSLRYSVFGLGSTVYPDFCAFACTVDTLLNQLGGERLMDVQKGDELSGQEEAFRSWGRDVFQVACQTFLVNRTSVNIDTILSKMGTNNNNNLRTTKFCRLTDAQDFSDPLANLEKLHGKKVHPCKLVARKKLQSPSSSRSTILIQLDTQGVKDLIYEPGDHVVIFPTNDKGLVQWILGKITMEQSLERVVQLETMADDRQTWKPVKRIPPCSVQTALSRYLDITTPPTPDFLRMLSNYTSDSKERDQVSLLGKGGNDYKAWLSNCYPNLADILGSYPSLKVPAWFLLANLPLLKPRNYSISSSPEVHPHEIHITVAVVKYLVTGSYRSFHKGVCSTWLEEISEEDVVPAYIKRAPSFHLPADVSKSAILIGPGTGIAPFRSFWQQRHHELQVDGPNVAHGKMILIFGCRHPHIDEIYGEETAKAAKSGALSQVFTAYSRVPGKPKKYVQNIIKEESALIFKHLDEEQSHFYVCGDNHMALDVRKTLEHILRSEGNMSSQEAERYICSMRESGRYHEDVFGVMIRTAQKKTAPSGTNFRLMVTLGKF